MSINFKKLIDILVKVATVIVRGRELGVWSKQAGPNIKPLGFMSVSTSIGPQGLAAIENGFYPKPSYSALISVQKGIKHFLLVAFYAVAAGFSAWLLNAPGVEAFLHSANVPTLLIGVLVPILAGLGRAVGNLNKNFNPQEGQE
jgi:hypothetical protein